MGWYPTTPATELSTIDMANARQVALRDRLRNHYWLTECKPLTAKSVELQRRKMVSIDPLDVLTDEQAEELLSEHYGFHGDAVAGWLIPDLQEHYRTALESIQGTRTRATAAGKASGVARAAGKAPPVASGGAAPAVPPVAVEPPMADADDVAEF